MRDLKYPQLQSDGGGGGAAPTWKRRNRPLSMPSVVLWPWLRPAPTMAPMWIMGPSGPTGSPDPTAAAADKNLTAKVRMLRICGGTNVFIF